MAIWYVMLFVVLLMPITMVGFGLVFMKNPPKRINDFYGYRTKRSMKNQDTWIFAHHFFGKSLLICGLVCVPLSLVPMCLVVDKGKDLIGMTGLIVVCLQAILMLTPIILTEKALKKNYDEFGRRR